VVAISHSAVVPAFREKFHTLGRLVGDLHLVLPAWWPEGNQRVAAPASGTESGITLHVLPVILPGKVGGFWLRGLPRLLRSLAPDLLHVEEEPFSFVCWQALRAAQSLRAPALFFTWENILRKYKPPLSWIDRFDLRCAGFAIAGNQDAAQVLQQRGFKGGIEILPQYGVDPERFRPVRASAPRGPWRIAYFGRLLEEKGLACLLRACCRLDFPFQLTLYGNGPYAGALRALAQELDLGKRLVWQAALPHASVPKEMAKQHALVLPSETRPDWKEQFGRVLIEAMACGVPVVGSSSGEIPHVIGPAGMVFPEGDEGGLAACLQRLHASPMKARKLAAAGRARVLGHFTTERIARRTAGLYRRILRKGE
jgi:glycosyltransferase involved in cell wall biosynthesis